MKHFFWLIAAVLATSAVVLLLGRAMRLATAELAQRWNRRGQTADAASVPVTKGHRWFSAIYDLVNRQCEAKVLSQFRPLIAGQATGRVLEIGAGTGADFPYYRTTDKIIAIEPDPFMLRRARKRAENLGLDVEFHRAPAEALPFDDASFDTVVATLVFCTVADPDRALAEVKRVLKPEGTFRFIEHVRAEGGLAARAQELLTPVWSRVGAGCHLNRRTVECIESAGFEIVELQRQPLALTPLVIGVARPKR